jgi:uncharacterized protein (DUF2164 family)
VDLVPAVDYGNRSLPIHINKVHAVRTLAFVASELGEYADWLVDIATNLERETG